MTRSELVDKISVNYPEKLPKDIDASVKILLDALSEGLAAGQRIEVRGFGSFGLNERASRVGRNPKSGEKVQVPSKKVPHFKAGKILRERVDRGV